MADPQHPASSFPSLAGIDLIELETFIAVAQERSFSQAAAKLHVTQPTVTGRIHRLEASLGASLLRRTTRKVEPTAQGELLLRESVRALEGLADLVTGFRRQAQRARQRVVIAATPTIAALRMPPVIQSYAERHPDVEVELRDLQYADALAAIDEGKADLAVMALDSDDRRYRFTPLWSDDMVLVAPRAHPLARRRRIRPEELVDIPLLLVDQYQTVRDRMVRALEERELKMPPPRVVRNLNTLLGMLSAGMGITLLPRSVSRRGSIAKMARIEVAEIDLTRTFGIVTSRNAQPGATLQSFIRFLRQSDLNPKS